ncbi:MAG: HPr family phosphocarrier protein [Planctomycetota bacterium]
MANPTNPKDLSSSSIEREVMITNKLGLHLRAAGRLVDVANRFSADIRIRKGQKEVDGKSIMEVMTLAATTGTPIVLCATGADARDAIYSLVNLVEGKFDEE